MDSSEAYEINALAFLAGRDKSKIGMQVVERWGRSLKKKATVLELACGGGYPITRTLNDLGLKLWAVDSSPTLVSEFHKRFPEIPVQCARAQESDFFGRKYDAVISVGLIFLMPEREQETLINRVSEILEPGGRFLLMAPQKAGSWNDMNTGIGCISLGCARYEALMNNAGLRVIGTHLDVGENNYYDAEKE